MKVLACDTEISPTGHINLPKQVIEAMNLAKPTKAHIEIRFQERDVDLSKYWGAWDGTVDPEALIDVIRKDRNKNQRSENSPWQCDF